MSTVLFQADKASFCVSFDTSSRCWQSGNLRSRTWHAVRMLDGHRLKGPCHWRCSPEIAQRGLCLLVKRRLGCCGIWKQAPNGRLLAAAAPRGFGLPGRPSLVPRVAPISTLQRPCAPWWPNKKHGAHSQNAETSRKQRNRAARRLHSIMNTALRGSRLVVPQRTHIHMQDDAGRADGVGRLRVNSRCVYAMRGSALEVRAHGRVCPRAEAVRGHCCKSRRLPSRGRGSGAALLQASSLRCNVLACTRPHRIQRCVAPRCAPLRNAVRSTATQVQNQVYLAAVL